MPHGLNDGFDHALVGVADLEAARLDWQRLGFSTCPRGKHIGWGTANYCIMFATDYLELLGIVDASQFTNNLDTFLQSHGEGLLGMAFASSELEALAEKLGGQPQDLKRLLELPEGTVEPRFRLLHPPPGTLPGLSGFFCRHLTPELMRRPEWLIHANGARGIAWMSIAVADVAAATVAYEQVLGADFVRQRVRLTQDANEPGLCGLGIEVGNLAATAAFFEDAGISYTKDDPGLSVQPEYANGARLYFVYSG
ncbi:MAG: VOC family protein [Rhodospirillaceae bacterium]|nr:VOC family protein [Rhodospirillaceae bacterium]MBL6940755.1 VOC family protein [Rhodospirillales bacterium]